MDALRRRTIENIKSAAFVRERAHAATSASPKYSRGDGYFARKILSVICGMRQINAAMVVARLLTRGMPDCINVAANVGRHRNSAVTAFCVLRQIALRLECGTRIVESGKEYWHGCSGIPGSGLWTKPDDVGSPVSSDSHLRPPHRTYGHGTSWLGVHANRLGKIFPRGGASHVFNIARRGISPEINHVQHTIAGKHSLRLNPAMWCPQQIDFGSGVSTRVH